LSSGNGARTGVVFGNITDNSALGFNHSNALTYANVGAAPARSRNPARHADAERRQHVHRRTLLNSGTLAIASDINLSTRLQDRSPSTAQC